MHRTRKSVAFRALKSQNSRLKASNRSDYPLCPGQWLTDSDRPHRGSNVLNPNFAYEKFSLKDEQNLGCQKEKTRPKKWLIWIRWPNFGQLTWQSEILPKASRYKECPVTGLHCERSPKWGIELDVISFSRSDFLVCFFKEIQSDLLILNKLLPTALAQPNV